MISCKKRYANEAQIIVSGIALILRDDNKILAVNLHNTRYRALLDKSGNILSSNMSDKSINEVKKIFEDNKEFI